MKYCTINYAITKHTIHIVFVFIITSCYLFYSNHTTYCLNLLFFQLDHSLMPWHDMTWHDIPCHSIRHNTYPWSHKLLLIVYHYLLFPPSTAASTLPTSSYRSGDDTLLCFRLRLCLYLFIAYVVDTWIVWILGLVELISQDLRWNETRHDSISYSSWVNQFF